MNTHYKKMICLTILAVVILGGGTVLRLNANQDTEKKEAVAAEAVSKIERVQAKQGSPSEQSMSSDQLVDAVMSNDPDKVLELINEQKVDINQKSSDGLYPLEGTLALENLEMAELLLENGADPNVVTQNGKTIKEEVMAGNSKMLKELFSEYPI